MRIVALSFACCFAVAATAAAPPESPTTAAEAAPSQAQTRLLVMELKLNDVDPATARTVQGLITTGLARYEVLDVLSGDDVKQLVELEGQRETAGCTGDASCLAEVADALGAKLVVFGSVGHLDDDVVLNLSLFDAEEAKGLGRVVVQTESVKALSKLLRPKLHELLARFYADRGLTLPALPPEPVEPPPPAAAPSGPGAAPWIVAGAGAAGVVLGGTLAVVGALPLLQYNDAKDRIVAAEADFADDPAAVDSASAAHEELAQARTAWNGFGYLGVDAGAVLGAIGLVVAVIGVGWGIASLEPEPPPAGLPTDAAATATPAATSAPASAATGSAP